MNERGTSRLGNRAHVLMNVNSSGSKLPNPVSLTRIVTIIGSNREILKNSSAHFIDGSARMDNCTA
jgi:hypothetical protein